MFLYRTHYLFFCSHGNECTRCGNDIGNNVLIRESCSHKSTSYSVLDICYMLLVSTDLFHEDCIMAEANTLPPPQNRSSNIQ